MNSIEDDIAALRERLAKVEAALERQRGQDWRRLATMTLLLLVASVHPALTLFLGALLLGGYAIVSLLIWMNESVNDMGLPRGEGDDADRTPAVDSPPG